MGNFIFSIKRILFYILRSLLYVFYILPVKDNKIVFRSLHGNKYSCNPKYICEYILENNSEDFKIIWIFNDAKKHSYLEKRGITVCSSNSISAIYHLLTSKFIIDNIAPVSYIPYRKKQCIINTWHGGGAYKQGFKNEKSTTLDHLSNLMGETDYYISSCRRQDEVTEQKWKIDKNRILPFGMARNDIFFHPDSSFQKAVKKSLNIDPDTGIVLYLPTFRHYESKIEYFDVGTENLINSLEKRFHKKFVFLYSLHFLMLRDKLPFDKKETMDVSFYEDVQELIASSDIILTDFSSVMWDAAVAKKPCFIYAADLEKYINAVGFDTPVEKWPFPIAKSKDELCKNVLSFDSEKYNAAIEKHLRELGSYENGTSAERTVELMLELKNEK